MKSHFSEWAFDLPLLSHNETIKFTSTPAIIHSPIRIPEEQIVRGWGSVVAVVVVGIHFNY